MITYTRALIAVLLFASGASASIVTDVRMAAGGGDLKRAESILAAYKSASGETSEYVEAYSWLARYSLIKGHYEDAEKYASATHNLVNSHLTARSLASDYSLQTALGAAIEVQAEALAAEGHRGEAVSYLRQQLKSYYNTPVRARIQKNINLLSLEGKPAPPLDEVHWLGVKPPALSALAGKPVLLFFWAHWCGDCRAEIPILALIKQSFSPRGLVMIGPTQHYGYIAGGQDATPDQETAYIDRVRRTVYAPLGDIPTPLSQENFNMYGVSTTPTIVVIDKTGRVVLYHPGAMSYDELARVIAKVV